MMYDITITNDNCSVKRHVKITIIEELNQFCGIISRILSFRRRRCPCVLFANIYPVHFFRFEGEGDPPLGGDIFPRRGDSWDFRLSFSFLLMGVPSFLFFFPWTVSVLPPSRTLAADDILSVERGYVSEVG